LKSILIIGGARSGKSNFAQQLALKPASAVLFVATAEAGDEEMKQRIAAHRKTRPPTWKTLEARTNLSTQIAQNIGKAQTVIIDCITLLINNIIQQYGQQSDEEIEAALIEKAVMAEIEELVNYIDQSGAHFIIVTNDVGLGLVPAEKVSRLYRDLLGKANQILAEHADEVYLMVAGIPVTVKPA
jgi:adenosylcobinamide kinase/adenosylcobinamide-phosphate guanylyltransferase